MRTRRLLPLALALALACGGEESPTGPGERAASLVVTPPSAAASALGDTTAFSARLRDEAGAVLSDVTIAWSSTDRTVATVTDDGEAVTQANGVTDVIAEAAGLADSARLTVDQLADRVTVSPSADTMAAGQTLQLSAEATDDNGRPVAGAVFRWTSSDTSVATVDSTGLVRARAHGFVDVTASLDGTRAAADLTVQPGEGPSEAPTVTSVTPTPLPEGGPVTISGANFATDASLNAVRVDGVEATVAAATDASLEVQVPSYECRPAREVTVEVTTSGGTATTAAPLEPAAPPLRLAVGEHRRVPAGGGACLQLAASDGPSAYLVGLQVVSEVAELLVPVELRSDAAGSLEGGAQALRPLPDARRGGGEPPRADPRWEAHAEAETERMRSARQLLTGRETASLPYRQRHADARLATPAEGVSADASVGDSVQLSVGTFDDVCQVRATITAEVRHVGTHGIWVTDVENLSGGYTDAEIRQLADGFDDPTYPTDTLHFGAPPDTDGNGRVVHVVTRQVNLEGGLLGFVSPGDLFPVSECAASNEGEYVYLVAPDPDGTAGPEVGKVFLLADQPRTLAHELVHVIQNGRRFAAGRSFLDVWLSEGQAMLGEEAVGHAVTGRSSGENLGFETAVEGGRSESVTAWYLNGFNDLARYYGTRSDGSQAEEAPEECGWLARDWAGGPCEGSRSVYGVPWSLLRWATDHYGPDHSGGKPGFQRDLVGGPGTGFSLLEELTGAPMDRMLARWAASLYVDDRVSSLDPGVEQPSWDFFDIHENSHPTTRLEPEDRSFTDFELRRSIRAGSSAYLRLSGDRRPATALRLRAAAGLGSVPGLQVWVIRLE